MAVRLVLAEGSFLARRALTGLLGDIPELELVAACRDADELRATVEEARPDIVLTEVPLPPSMTDEGLQLAAELRRTHPQTGVIILSDRCDPDYARALLEPGDDGRAYLLKERLGDPGQLLAAIDIVRKGGSFIDPKVVDALVGSQRSPIAGLDTHERATLVEMARGASNAAIAGKLGITERAVERSIHAIFEKLELPRTHGVNRRVLAVVLFVAAAGPPWPG